MGICGNKTRSLEGEGERKQDGTVLGRHVRVFICFGVILFLHIIVAIVLAILFFTVLSGKKPAVSVTSLTVQNFDIIRNTTRFSPSMNVTAGLDLNVVNPNYISFRYASSTAFIYYRGEDIAEAPIPSGRVGPRKTERVLTTCKIFADRLSNSHNLTFDLASGVFPLSSHTYISGRINFLNIFKRHIHLSTVCDMIYSLQSHSVGNMKCTFHGSR